MFKKTESMKNCEQTSKRAQSLIKTLEESLFFDNGFFPIGFRESPAKDARNKTQKEKEMQPTPPEITF
ncbi:hypothetical protein [Legionella brunensis]|uniref:Uncharacterized protein n=1 Tax=Legionella brunensis TaxID=29422 RepID=A0A0W0SEK2_9GAMM|nr:hypothetical protein [Legionella brunensis]KTC81611.1 hypothetical protein Lbru_2131 [Legionella brunensis]